MATFNFGEANGTSLETINSAWDGDSANLITNGGVIQPDALSSGFGSYIAYFNNGQGANQSAQCVLKAGSFAGGQRKSLYVQRNGGQLGYEARWAGNSSVALYRNGVYQAGASGTESPVDHSTTDATIKLAILAGTLTVSVNGTPIASLTTVDGSPLTGGFPGMQLDGVGTPSTAQMDDWTDGVSASAQIAARNGIALSGVSALNGITKTGISAINGLTI